MSDGDLHFPGSRIILNNATWGEAVNTWAKEPAAQVWSLCYSSFTDNHDTPATFHTQCDQHNITVAFARNSLGYTFGGYVRGLFRLSAPFFSLVLCLLMLSCIELYKHAILKVTIGVAVDPPTLACSDFALENVPSRSLLCTFHRFSCVPPVFEEGVLEVFWWPF